MNIKLFGLLTLFLFPFVLQSQIDRSKHQLLWEISGNGLSKPSFLLGTIHLKDERVFEFCDSLYHKLEHAEAFALEVHPDSINSYLLELYSNRDTTNTLKESLSSSAYDDINRLLFEKVGKTIEDLKNKNPFLIEMMLRDKANEKETDKDLFMDLYLYRIARNQGKQTFGLEKIQDHENLTASYFRTFENNTEIGEFDNFIVPENPFESLINLYLTGDLDLIQMLTNYDEDDEYHFELINKRNHIIADNIVDLIHQQSTFNAIGAAHLPGEEGVIELLRAKGYKMRVVTAEFTGKAESYQYKKSTPIWYPFRTDFYRYRVSFPGKPYKLENEKRHRLITNIQLYNDIAENQFYSAICITLFTNEGINNDSFLIKEIKSRFLQEVGYKLLSVNNLEVSEGLEFIVQKEEEKFQIGRAFYANDNLYFITVERNDDDFEHQDISRFFDSFQLYEQINKSWTTFSDKEGGFSVLMPHEPDYQNIVQQIEYNGEMQEYSLHVYMARDLEKGTTFLIRYNDLPEGKVSENDTIMLNSIHKLFEDRIKKDFTSKVIYKEGYEGREYFYQEDSLFIIRVQTFFRGNRMYLLIGQSIGGNIAPSVVDNFLNSFKFEPFLPADLSKYSYEEDEFEISFPKDPFIESDTFHSYNFPYEYNKLYSTTDSNSGSVYGVSRSKFSKYYREESLDSMINLIVENTLDATDTLLESKDLTINNFPAKQIKIGSSIINSIYNSVILIKGNTIFEIFLYAQKNADDTTFNSFINSFSISESPIIYNITESKIEQIINDLQSQDGDVFQKAETGLSYYNLRQEELPFIYEAFYKEYPNDTLGYSTIQEIICNHLTLVNDEKSVPFLIENYHSSTEDSEKQIAILTAIVNIEKTDSINIFFNLAKDYQEAGDDEDIYYYYLFERFHDSLELAQAYFPQLIELNKNKIFQGQIASIINSILDIDSLDNSFIEPYKSGFCKQANAIVKEHDLMSKDTVNYFSDYWVLSNLIDIVTHLRFDEESETFFNSLLKINSQALRAQVMFALIKNGKKVSKKHWNYVYTDLYEWHSLLLSLEKKDLLGKAPANQLNKKNVAKAALYGYVYDDYSEPSKMKILDVQPFQYQGEELSICVMEFYYYEDDGPYLSIISQPKEKGKFNLSPKIIDTNYNIFEEGEYQAEVDKLLANYKE